MWILMVLFQRLLESNLSHWLDFSVFPHASPTFVQYLHLDMFVCFHYLIEHWWSNFCSHFPQRLVLSVMKYIPAFDIQSLSVIFSVVPPLPWEIFFDWCNGFCCNSSSWLAMCYILLGFFKLSIFQVVPQLNSTTFDLLPPPKKKTTCEFLQSAIFVVYSYFKYVTCHSLWFFPQILQHPKAVFAWYFLQPDWFFVSWNP